jgi:hypothetical protein
LSRDAPSFACWLCRDQRGQTVSVSGGGWVYAHVTLADPDKAFGGHLKAGTSVFTFTVVTVGVFKDGMDLKGVDDKNCRQAASLAGVGALDRRNNDIRMSL